MKILMCVLSNFDYIFMRVLPMDRRVFSDENEPKYYLIRTIFTYM